MEKRKKKFKETKVGAFLTEKAPELLSNVGEFLPDQGYSYTTPLPQDIIEASSLINYYNSIGDDKMVNEIKIRLKNAGYDLKDYNLG